MLKLLPYQRAGLPWLLDRPRACLADDQGLGKTITSLVSADLIAERILVVCPTAVLHNWLREADEWIGRPGCALGSKRDHIIRGSTIVSMTHRMLLSEHALEEVERYAPDLVILDESHMLRSPSAKTAQTFYTKVARPANYAWCLTGTPMPSWPTNLWMMLHHMWPTEFPESFEDFRSRYCLLGKPFRFGAPPRIFGTKRLTELRARVEGKILRRLKSEELNLPPLRHDHVALTPSKMPHELIDPEEIQKDAALADALKLADTNAESFMILRHFMEGSTLDRQLSELKCDPVAELLTGELDGDAKAKRVVFYHHRSVFEKLEQAFARFEPALLAGHVSADDRDHHVQRFQNDPRCRVALCQLVAGGTGVTLTAADDVTFVEASWVPGDNAQARDRVYRIGQSKPCRVRFVSLANTLDEVRMRVLRRKTAAIQGVIR